MRVARRHPSFNRERAVLQGPRQREHLLPDLGQERRSKAPMLPLAMFRDATFSVANAIGRVVNFAYDGLVFVFSLFFQSVEQLSARQTGLAFLPMTGILMVMNLVAGRFLHGMHTSIALAVVLLAAGAAVSYSVLQRMSSAPAAGERIRLLEEWGGKAVKKG